MEIVTVLILCKLFLHHSCFTHYYIYHVCEVRYNHDYTHKFSKCFVHFVRIKGEEE